jgi:hypothetical protein
MTRIIAVSLPVISTSYLYLPCGSWWSVIVTCFRLLRICKHLHKYIAEAVSRWLTTAAARVRARVWQVWFVMDKVASGQVFSEYFGFPCQTRSFHQLPHHHNQQMPCDELITRPRSPADCPRSSNRNETESFMEAAKAQNWAVEPQEKMKDA